MPDAQTLNAVLGAYGVANPIKDGGLNWWSIGAGILFGIIGWSAFLHGKKEKNYRPMLLGIALMVYPYFVPSTLFVMLIGVALSAALFLWKE